LGSDLRASSINRQLVLVHAEAVCEIRVLIALHFFLVGGGSSFGGAGAAVFAIG